MADNDKAQESALIPYREPVGAKEIAPFIPADFPSVFRFSQLLAESGDMVPKAYANNAPKIATAIFFGYELGLLPLQALQSVAVINGKPSIYGDAALALVRGSGKLDDFEEFFEGDFYLPDGKPNPNFKAVCKTTRVGAKRAALSEFSIGDAIMAGLFNKDGPWKQYPKRMLKMRARGFGLRDEFTDVLRGLVLAEEAHDIEPLDITPGRSVPPPPDDEPNDPAGGDDTKPKRRGRPPKNQYENAEPNKATGDGKAGGKFPDPTGEIEDVDTSTGEVKTTAATTTKPAETKPVETKPTETNKPAEKAEPKPATPKIFTAAEAVPDMSKVSDSVKPFLESFHKDIYLTTDLVAAKSVYSSYFSKRKLEGDDDVVFKLLRDWHKERISNPPAEGEQADDGSSPPPPDDEAAVLNYDAFRDALDKGLGEENTPAGVNAAYAALTEIPIRDKILTPEQEEELKGIWEAHLNRVDF